MIVETLVTLFVLGVAIGLLAMILLPLPFLRCIGVAGMQISLISVIWRSRGCRSCWSGSETAWTGPTFVMTTGHLLREPPGPGWSCDGAAWLRVASLRCHRGRRPRTEAPDRGHGRRTLRLPVRGNHRPGRPN
jgi:hypothetical protein